MLLLTEQYGPLRADFRRFYQVGLAEVRDRCTLTEFADMAANLPAESTTHRALNPAWRATAEAELLRAIEFRLHVIEWRGTTDGRAGRNVPEPIRFSWEPEPKRDHDVMSWDEAADFLGWGEEMNRFFNDDN